MENNFLIPLLNPVRFYEVDRANLPKYFTRHFDDYMYEERILDWESPEEYAQVWQTDDIIYLQFVSTFDPITVELIDNDGNVIVPLPALIGLPNKFYPNTFCFEVELSLAGLTTGCYYVRLTAGSGPTAEVMESNWMYISAEPIRNTVLIEYWNSRFMADIMFESGIKFQLRIHGHYKFIDPVMKAEIYEDQRANPTILNSNKSRQFPWYFGDEYGLPDDMIDVLASIWGCDNVKLDNKFFCLADGKFEFIEFDSAYPRRGLKLILKEGLNRSSKLIVVNTDTTKKLAYGIMVDKKVFGDTSNQGSSNAVPVIKVI